MSNQPNKMRPGRFRKSLNRTVEQWQPGLLPCTCLIACLTQIPTSAMAQAKPTPAPQPKCSQQAIHHLEDEPEHIRDWSKLRNFYHRYNPCAVDDAEVETGVGTAVVHVLLNKWASLATANQLFREDPVFKTFALAGLNITDSTADLNRIDRRARKNCAPGLHNLCREIRAAIRNNN